MHPHDFLSLDIQMAHMMVKCITKIEANEMLNGMVISNFPNLDKNGKQALIKQMQKQAEIKKESKQSPVSNMDVSSWLKGVFGG